MDNVELLFEPLPPSDLSKLVEENVIEHTIALTGALEWSPTNYFLRSARGDWVGGCLGMTWGGWLQIRFLWVTERLRGQGQGTRLLNAAETHAAANGATAATLETFNPAALRFYCGRGYSVFGALEDYPPGHTKHFLRKSFAAPAGR